MVEYSISNGKRKTTEGSVMTHEAVGDASRGCYWCRSSFGGNGAFTLIELGGRRSDEFSSASHCSWCWAVSPIKLVRVAAWTGGACCDDDPVVRAAS